MHHRSRIALCALVLALSATVPTPATAAALEISWDHALASEQDRESYQRQLRDILERGYELVSAELGFSLERPLKVVVYAPASYEKQFGAAAAWEQGAHYQASAIHVNGGRRLDDGFAGLIVHELTHAVLDHRGSARQLPLWLNEGLAERLSYKRRGQEALAPNQVAALQYEGRQRTLVPLPTWGRVSWNYLQCYAAALFLEKKAGREKMLSVVRRALDGEPFERALDQELRWSFKDLEREFSDWIEHLS